ncbi:hypothetical protein D3C83_40230 [compost metagenome]
MLEQFPLGIIDDLEQGLELPPLRGLEMLENEVLPQLEADDLRFRVLGEQGHLDSLRRGKAAGGTGEYTRMFLTGVKAAAPAQAYI